MHDAPPSRFLDRFGWLLVLVLVSIVCQALIDVADSRLAAGVIHAISGAVLVLAVRVAGASLRWRRAADVLVVALLASNVAFGLSQVIPVNAFDAPEGLQPELSWLIAAAVAPVVVARRLLNHSTVTIQTVLGSVSAYLQIAIAYAFAFQAIGALSHRDFFDHPVPTTSYMSVSLQTITTLGSDGLVPATAFGQLITVSEAVIGQVFLVTFVALIVTRFAASPSGPPLGGVDPDASPAKGEQT